MSDINALFVEAIRKKVRFASTKGSLSVEDLWDLPLSGKGNLDDIAVELHRQLSSEGTTISFVNATKVSAATRELQMKFDLVKHVIETRMAENASKQEAAARAEQRAHIDSIIASKQEDALRAMSVEDLLKLRG